MEHHIQRGKVKCHFPISLLEYPVHKFIQIINGFQRKLQQIPFLLWRFFQKQWFRRLFLFCFQGLRLFLLPTMVIICVLADGKEPWANIPLPVKSVNGFQGFEKSFLSDFLCQHTVTAQPPDIEQHIPENARYTWSKSMFFPLFTQFTRQNEKRYSTLQIFYSQKKPEV